MILNDALLPWARKHFGRNPWTFQQDSAPSHKVRETQRFLQEKVPRFISSQQWPPFSTDLNPIDFSIWSILEAKVSTKKYQTVNASEIALRKIPYVAITVLWVRSLFCVCNLSWPEKDWRFEGINSKTISPWWSFGNAVRAIMSCLWIWWWLRRDGFVEIKMIFNIYVGLFKNIHFLWLMAGEVPTLNS